MATGLSGWIRLAAAPGFAAMAVLAGLPAGGAADLLCGHGTGMGGAGGMVPMYLLMSVAHLPPWLRLLARRGRRRPATNAGPGCWQSGAARRGRAVTGEDACSRIIIAG